jgi:hypothetical protein
MEEDQILHDTFNPPAALVKHDRGHPLASKNKPKVVPPLVLLERPLKGAATIILMVAGASQCPLLPDMKKKLHQSTTLLLLHKFFAPKTPLSG